VSRASALPFDRVVLSTPDGRQELSVQQFLELPLHRRGRLLLQQDLAFFAGPSPVNHRDALRALMLSAPPRSLPRQVSLKPDR
jgi:hypothetical protein